jgi:hypothetical protein
MNATQYTTQVKIRPLASAPGEASEMSRLINAALVAPGFCELLLTNPEAALAQGYNGESFSLTARARHFVLTTQATSIADFARAWGRLSRLRRRM